MLGTIVRIGSAAPGVYYVMFALWRMLGFRRFLALWLLRLAWRMYQRRRLRPRTRSAF
jgi:hypothetical protein